MNAVVLLLFAANVAFAIRNYRRGEWQMGTISALTALLLLLVWFV